MKLCKKLFSFILVLSIMLSSVSAFAAPNANESGINEYNLAPGTTVICVEAFVLGWGYVLEPTVVAYNPGETLAQLTARVLAANSLACVMNGAADDDASYIQGIGCPQLAAGASPSVPAYLMTELEAYPDWAEENLGYQPGGWNGTENGDGILSEFEYSDLGGWISEVDIAPDMLGAHHIISATVCFAGDNRNFRHCSLTISIKQFCPVTNNSAIFLIDSRKESRNIYQ